MWLQNSYLYYRMYQSKIRDTVNYWWRTYLLCKCCVLVIPAYTFLLTIGLYCIIYNIDVQSSIKTIYEVLLLLFSAVAIFILVLFLATIRGSYNRSDDSLTADQEDAIAMSLSASRRHRYQPEQTGNQQQQQQKSLASSIMTTLFGTYDDPDDPDAGYDSDELNSLDPITIQQLNLLDQEALQHLLDVDQQHQQNQFDLGNGPSILISNPLLEHSENQHQYQQHHQYHQYHFPALVPPNQPTTNHQQSYTAERSTSYYEMDYNRPMANDFQQQPPSSLPPSSYHQITLQMS